MDMKGSAGVNFWVVDTSADISRLSTHELETTMTPAGEEFYEAEEEQSNPTTMR